MASTGCATVPDTTAAMSSTAPSCAASWAGARPAPTSPRPCRHRRVVPRQRGLVAPRKGRHGGKVPSAGAVGGCPAAIPAWTCSRVDCEVAHSKFAFEMRLGGAMWPCCKRIGGPQWSRPRRGGCPLAHDPLRRGGCFPRRSVFSGFRQS